MKKLVIVAATLVFSLGVVAQNSTATPSKNETKKMEAKQETKPASPKAMESKPAAAKSSGMEHKSDAGKEHQSPNATVKKVHKKSVAKHDHVKPAANNVTTQPEKK